MAKPRKARTQFADVRFYDYAMSLEQVAEELGLTVAHVSMIQIRAIRKLRAQPDLLQSFRAMVAARREMRNG